MSSRYELIRTADQKVIEALMYRYSLESQKANDTLAEEEFENAKADAKASNQKLDKVVVLARQLIFNLISRPWVRNGMMVDPDLSGSINRLRSALDLAKVPNPVPFISKSTGRASRLKENQSCFNLRLPQTSGVNKRKRGTPRKIVSSFIKAGDRRSEIKIVQNKFHFPVKAPGSLMEERDK